MPPSTADADRTGPSGAGERPLQSGFEHHRAGRLAEAEACYRTVLASDPLHADALHHLGLIRHQQGRSVEGVQLILRAIHLDDSRPQFALNLATVLQALGRAEDAEMARGMAALQAGKPERAAALARGLAERAPGHAGAQRLLAQALEAQERPEEAEAAYTRAAALDPAHPGAFLGLAALARSRKDYDAALAHLERVPADDTTAWVQRGQILVEQGRHDEAVAAYRQALALQPDLRGANSALLYCQHYMDLPTAGALRAEHEAWAARHTAALPRYQRWANPPDPGRTLRIGVISPELRAHPAGLLLLPMLRHHDPERLHITCYADGGEPDELTATLKRHAERWVAVGRWSDSALAERIRADGIDVLLERTGHQTSTRLSVYARHPAPVQASLLGYLCTRGLPEIGAVLGDALLSPPALQEQWVERLAPLDGPFLCFEPMQRDEPVAPPPCLRSGYVTFGSFNNASKITPRTVALWARVMAAVPDARLYVRAPQLAHPASQARLGAVLAAAGIPAQRVRFGGGSGQAAYLRDFAQIDLHLDTVPNNGVVTTLDALWMGVPVLALWGDEVRSRVAATLVSHAGHPEWAAADADAYAALAARLAAAPQQLADLRAGQRQALRDSALCDGPGYARRMEATLRRLWGEWCASQTVGAS